MSTVINNTAVMDSMHEIMGYLSDYDYIIEICVAGARAQGHDAQPPTMRAVESILDQGVQQGLLVTEGTKVQATTAGWEWYENFKAANPDMDHSFNTRTKFHGWSEQPW